VPGGLGEFPSLQPFRFTFAALPFAASEEANAKPLLAICHFAFAKDKAAASEEVNAKRLQASSSYLMSTCQLPRQPSLSESLSLKCYPYKPSERVFIKVISLQSFSILSLVY
jgi:hypothetical protein